MSTGQSSAVGRGTCTPVRDAIRRGLTARRVIWRGASHRTCAVPVLCDVSTTTRLGRQPNGWPGSSGAPAAMPAQLPAAPTRRPSNRAAPRPKRLNDSSSPPGARAACPVLLDASLGAAAAISRRTSVAPGLPLPRQTQAAAAIPRMKSSSEVSRGTTKRRRPREPVDRGL